MKTQPKATSQQKRELIEAAENCLALAQKHLARAGAKNARNYVARARKSVQGAMRHARSMELR